MLDRIGCALIALCVASPALAQESEIIVTGRGLEAPPGDAAYAVATIDRARLADTASNRIEDVLADVAGLVQFRRSTSSSAHPTSQGITLRGLGGNASSRALLLLDGVPQADPFGGWVPFPAYLPGRLASVRVTRGGGSGFAGPGALAGTVELESGSPAELGTLNLSAFYGSRDSIDASGVAALPVQGGFLTIAGQYGRSDGFVPIVRPGPVDRAAPYDQASLAVRGVADVGHGTELQANVSGFSDRRDRGTAFTDVRSKGADASVRLVRRGDGQRGEWGWSVLGYLQVRQFDSGFASISGARDSVLPVVQQAVPATGIGGRIEIAPPVGGGITLRLGGDLRRVSGETRELYSFIGTSPTRRRVAGGASLTAGGFANASYIHGGWTLDAGGRLDHWTIADGSLAERPLASGPAITDTRYRDRRGWEPTGRLGVAYAVGALHLRAAGYRGWRLPTLNELYRPFRAGADATAANAALAPERLWGGEVGLDLCPASALVLRATGYWNRLDGAIANVTLARGPGNFPGVGFVGAAGAYRMRQNLDAVEARGVELDARWTQGAWRLAGSWAYADSRVQASGAAAPLNGLRPAQTPRFQGSGTLAWATAAANALVTARYAGARFEDDLNSARLDPAWTVDATLGVAVTRALRAEARAENLFDAEVQAAISGGGVIERATPRTLWIGLRYAMR
ncbi:TonB-dependent receptor [Sphingomonas pokkalii]|uniref:TonB-dependent receptor n=1 Tax=Sphingomonas pokkalii TaxID=2175090 RepID=A0A2U0SET6_9SPHN|nr:TonB-dependent receptor [Sphingomonas pokkalii]PVX29869.1 TonB-dependent receptor [Sphingomonas pokkalii]